MPNYRRGKAKKLSYGSLKAGGKFTSAAKTSKGSFPRKGKSKSYGKMYGKRKMS